MIDLASDDPDGNPNANSIYAVSGTLYVTLDLLDSMSMPEGPGKPVMRSALIGVPDNVYSPTLPSLP